MPQSNMAAIATARQQSSGAITVDSRASEEQKEFRLKATQFLKEAQSTRRLVDRLEKDRSLSVECKKNGWSDMATELDEYEKTLVEQRSAHKTQLRKQLAKIKDGVKEFQQQLIDMTPSTELIEKLKESMSELEFSINNLKEEQRICFGELLKEERTCSLEMEAYERKVENWSQPRKSSSKVSAASAVKGKALNQDLPSEVRALEAFLQKTGGVCGGWEEFDHQAFLKAWTKHGGRAGFRKEAKLYLPGKSQEEIEEHERWYQELIYLQEKRREAIQRWRNKKQLARQTHLQKEVEVEEVERRKKDARCQKNKQESKSTNRKAKCSFEIVMLLFRSEEKKSARRPEMRKEVKRSKELQAEEQKRPEEGHKNGKAKQVHCRQQEAKPRPREQLQGEEGNHRRTRKRKETTKAIQSSIKRDLERVQTKRQEKLLRQKEDGERLERIMAKLKDKVDGHIVRDPSRLTRPTKGWEERMKSMRTSGGGTPLLMSHRTIPTWRLGL
ncbi:coiled-coil domain-containing protein 112 isoform X3 [Syngnathus scovelli]|uniref:coiled-coil domain-containing protein 112 isoform X3 n=1 Tax=Syngnathus scovelli TaxID=161590 RepID=UPI00210F44E3|nr:coiled-coil domain-containing protein 112 isoform X2 [Syngnathus scovelli]